MSKVKPFSSVLAGLTVVALIAFSFSRYGSAKTNPIAASVAASKKESNDNAIESPLPTAASPGVTANTSAVSKIDWRSKYAKSENYYEFVPEAVRSALNGDGRASYYLSKVMFSCAGVIKLNHSNVDPAEKFNEDRQQNAPYMPEAEATKQLNKIRLCAHLGKDDVFAGTQLQGQEEAYRFKYWRDKALTQRDPIAEAEQANSELLTVLASPSTDDAKNAVLERSQGYINHAVASNEAEALFKVGILLSNGNYSSNPLRGVALSIAACELGYDCSTDNMANVWSACKYTGACPAGENYESLMQKSLGEERYAQAYAQAQDVRGLLARQDWSELRKYYQLEVVAK